MGGKAVSIFTGKAQIITRIAGAAIIAGSLAGLAQASTGILKASQTSVIHSEYGIGCQDISTPPKGGNFRAGACVEFQISIRNRCDTNTANAINFENPVDKDLIFVAANVAGFETVTLDMPDANTDCSKEDCVISIRGASLKPQHKGTLKIRAIVK